MPGVSDNKMHFFWQKDRKASFKSWPFTDKHDCSITKMAEAGFYWCGTIQENDAAACFLCGKMLDGWEPTDNPWSEHKKHSPQCQFVKLGRPERDLTVGEAFDLLDSYTQKLFDNNLEESMKNLTELGNRTRIAIQAKLKSGD